MDEHQMREMIRGTFDEVSDGYDIDALRFFRTSARNLAGLLALKGDEQVLDVATGTGHVALEIARMLPRGHVTGIDFSAGMLEQARAKAEAIGAANIDFIQMDMHSLSTMTGAYDAAVCAFGIFFVENMEEQLRLIASAVRPGGSVAVTTFDKDYFQPLAGMLFRRLEAYGIQRPPHTWKRIGSKEGCEQLLVQAGLEEIRVEFRYVGYHIDKAEEWWDVVWNGGYRRMVGQLKPGQLEKFRREHLEEVEACRSGEGIWLDIGVFYAFGTNPR